MIETIKQILGNNPLAQGGILLMFGGSIMGLLYKSYYWALRLIKYFCFVKINFESVDGENFRRIQYWLWNLPYSRKRCNNFNIRDLVKKRRVNSDYDDEQDENQIFFPGYGSHYLFIKRRPSIISYYKSDGKEIQFRETIELNIFCLFRKTTLLESIIDEINKLYSNVEYNTKIYTCTSSYGCWMPLHDKKLRQNPILSYETEYQELLDDINTFLDNEEWYDKRGIGYKRGYLFSGVPGSGKSSCILSVAQYFKKHIYILNLSSGEIDDNKFVELVSNLPKDAILALEDIDAATNNMEDRKENKKDRQSRNISLSTMLNILDGLYTPDGLIFFITTNHPDKLDKALIRPGRISVFKDFNNANAFQTRTIFTRFFPEASEEYIKSFVNKGTNKSMSLLESHLIKYCNDIKKASQI